MSRRLLWSSTSMLVRGTVTVAPPGATVTGAPVVCPGTVCVAVVTACVDAAKVVKALGWETCGVSVMRIVRLPWAMATVFTRTRSPMTMVPDFSSITTRAMLSGSTRSCSISVIKPTMSPWRFSGSVTPTVPGSVAVAIVWRAKPLIAWAMRRAVVKSGLRRARFTALREANWKLVSRSTMAPLAIRPEVGVPRVMRSAAPVAEKPEIATEPWATA